MFRGANAINLDAKGRLAMPSRYRDELDSRSSGQLIVTIDAVDPCLCVYPLDEWEIIEAKLRALPSLREENRRLQRLLIGTAVVGATTMIFSIIVSLTQGLEQDIDKLSPIHAPFLLGLIAGGAISISKGDRLGDASGALTLDGGPHLQDAAVRRWMGETFLARVLPYMAGRAVDDDYDFPGGD